MDMVLVFVDFHEFRDDDSFPHELLFDYIFLEGEKLEDVGGADVHDDEFELVMELLEEVVDEDSSVFADLFIDFNVVLIFSIQRHLT